MSTELTIQEAIKQIAFADRHPDALRMVNDLLLQPRRNSILANKFRILAKGRSLEGWILPSEVAPYVTEYFHKGVVGERTAPLLFLLCEYFNHAPEVFLIN